MLKQIQITLLTVLAVTPGVTHAQPTTANSEAVGFVTVNVTPAVGTSRRTTYLSFPLLQTVSTNFSGQAVGTITGVASNSISNTNANWTPGALSQPSSPYAVQITSGDGAGRIFLIASSANTAGASGGTANTASTVFLSNLETAAGNTPTAAGSVVKAGDSYRIIEVDTLDSVFGTPATTGIRGGTSASAADNVTLIVNGSATSYFYSTGSGRWTRIGATVNSASGNVALVPYLGVIYSRLGTNALSFRVPGTVPNTARKSQIKNFGITTMAQYWPSDTTLAGLGLHNLPGWLRGASSTNSDNVILVSGGGATTYWHNNTSWRAVGFMGSRDTTVVPAGSAIYILKRGNTPGFTTLNQQVPYNLGL